MKLGEWEFWKVKMERAFPGSSEVNNSEVDSTLMNNTHMRSILVNHSVIDCCILGWNRASVRR